MSYTDDYAESGRYSKADQQRRLAQLLAAQGASTEPIASGWQGAARLAQALAGVMGNRAADKREAAAIEARARGIAPYLGGGGGGAAAPDAGPATTGSVPSGGGGGIGSDYAAGMTPEEAIVRTVAGEAAGEPAEGQAAVASVIMNRVKQSGQSPQQVVLAKNQFEPWSRNPQQLMALTRDSPKYQQILANIQPALQGQDVTGGATHFYAPRAQAALGRSTPGWARGPYQDIGNHRFFKLAGGPTGQTAALPGVVPVGSAPTPDMAQFLGQGTQSQQPPSLAARQALIRQVLSGAKESPADVAAEVRKYYAEPPPAGAALPNVQPMGSTPSPDVAAFLGTGALTGSGTRPGPGYVPAPAPIGRGAVAQPVPGTPMPTRPTVTGSQGLRPVVGPSLPSNDPMVQPSAVSPPDALGRTTPGATGPNAMPQPIQQGGHVLMAQQPPAPLPRADRGVALLDPSAVPSSIDAPAARAPVPPQPSNIIDPREALAGALHQPAISPPASTPPVAPPAPIIGRTPAPIQPPAPQPRPAQARPAAAVASPVVPPAVGPRQRGQIFREPYPSVLSAQEFARQGQNYLTGRPSFANQQRVAPRTMQEPVAGMAGGAPAGSPAAAPVSPRQGLLQRLFGGGGGGGAAAAQGAPAGSPGAGAGQPVDAQRMALARALASGRLPAWLGAEIYKRQNPPPPDPYTLSPGQVRYGPDGRPIASVPTAPERPMTVSPGATLVGPDGKPIYTAPATPEKPPSAVQEYEYAKGQGFKGTFEQWEASKKGGMSLVVDPETGQVTFQQGANIKPLTEAQSKDTVYATRAEGALTTLDKMDEQLASLGGNLAGRAGPLGNYLKSPEYQQAEQAGQEFLTAILRKDTGAAITKGEIDTYGATYLPGPGDGPEVIAQKKQSRTRALAALKAGMTPQAILNQEMALRKTAPPPQAANSRPTATDPKTGAQVEWDGTAWVPVK